MWGIVWVRRRSLNALAYALPAEGEPYMPGIRLLVPLGRHNSPYIGLLMEVREEPPSHPLKEVLQKIDPEPLYDPKTLDFFRWIVEYYMASPGDVIHAVLPGRMGGIKDWVVRWTSLPLSSLPPKKLYQHLRTQSEFRIRTMAQQLEVAPRKLLTLVRKWMQKGACRIEPIVRTSMRRPPSFVEVDPAYREPTRFEAVWNTLSSEHRALLLEILHRNLRGEPLLLAHLRRQYGKRLAFLLRSGYLRLKPARHYYEQLYARPIGSYTLTPPQQEALRHIRLALQDKPYRPVLLHGVTASGKTFVYMELMREVLRTGGQVLYLLPEIALTKQTLDRLRATFGEAMELYHSSLSEAERFRLWKAVREDAVDVIVGTRSALFLPFHRLSLIIVDEEHDPSFGQESRSPFYQARDAAVYYAHLKQIPIVLGSATPSLESYSNAQLGKYAYVPLRQKAIPTASPELHVVDMRAELAYKLSTGVFSSVLREMIEEKLKNGEQVILFRNRRGYAPTLLCQSCGHRWECPHCAITLTYHKWRSALSCHYCGYQEKLPAQCSVCGSETLFLLGVGTERIEEQLQQFFPNARTLRLDRDTVGRHRHEAIISAFERGEADILIGTQMVTKGLDFERVTLVGVLYADSLLARTDFRAEERAYQLLIQLIGRAGRRGKTSSVVIQTFRPETPLFHQLNDPYESYAERALDQRRHHGYPPFRRLLQINLYHKETLAAEKQGEYWRSALSKLGISEVLGPVYAEVPRVRGRYHLHLLLKLPSRYPYQKLRQTLLKLREDHYVQWGSHAARVVFRVDP
ncbi:MAG: primosomal protein N' [Bacteroidia bacterium]|nr:primosomal protein N' [Bacteroidia bacterium]MDW8014530.1 primosomal protein N' [Bacteroidia bacterium]